MRVFNVISNKNSITLVTCYCYWPLALYNIVLYNCIQIFYRNVQVKDRVTGTVYCCMLLYSWTCTDLYVLYAKLTREVRQPKQIQGSQRALPIYITWHGNVIVLHITSLVIFVLSVFVKNKNRSQHSTSHQRGFLKFIYLFFSVRVKYVFEFQVMRFHITVE